VKLYILVDSSLPLAYRSVQGGHAVAQWLLDHPAQSWNNHILVYLDCPDLELWQTKLQRYRLDYSVFIEPDLGNQLTALAVYTDKKVLSRLNLMN